jgi:alpha-L-rhamnosidase
MNRREFLKTSGLTSTSLLLAEAGASGAVAPAASEMIPAASMQTPKRPLPDLSPAAWIWFPSGRTLQNTFILFRRELKLASKPRRATGWIAADSRYRLEVNGKRIQWGPAPSDPRWPEADPLDLTNALREGENVIGATVLFYGQGDGTWPLGKPGFLFWLEMEHADGQTEGLVSDAMWQCHLCRAWPPGRYKRWYLRALQEEFDARLYPAGWSEPAFKPDTRWLPAMLLDGSPNKPALSAGYYEYMLDVGGGPPDAELRPRSIPLMRESFVPVKALVESHWFTWKVAPNDYFDFRVPEAYAAEPAKLATETANQQWSFDLDGQRGAGLTFEFTEQVVGWPGFSIEAPAGTMIELLVHEAHAVGGPPLLNTHFDSWTRFICKEGRNDFEAFDFESFRWVQLHIHGSRGRVVVSHVRARRRQFPWPNDPRISCGEPALQRLFDASVNTLHNSAQETLVDGMARERQQYSGDGGHQLHGVHLAFGEQRLVARYLATWSQGMTKDGFFLDCWPAYDRLARLVERQLDLTGWGPILDHGVGFNFDCWSHYIYTGNLEALREPYPRLLRFAAYLQSIVGKDGLLPVENLGIPSVWIDHVAYQRQAHKHCAFNLYAAAAMQHALAPLCQAFGEEEQARAVRRFGVRLQETAVSKFWSPERNVFINNLPWLAQEKEPRMCDRSLATAVLFDQCPGGETTAAVKTLAECPPQMGFSYPANAGWRLWALGKARRADVIVQDLRTRWAPMKSVLENNTLQEDWEARHDSGQQWSHCAVVPLYIAYHSLVGLKPLLPGFQKFQVSPQLGDLPALDLTAFTVKGPIRMQCQGAKGNRDVTLEVPPGAEAELVVDERETIDLPVGAGSPPPGCRQYRLPASARTSFLLKFS